MTQITLLSPVEHDGKHYDGGEYIDVKADHAEDLLRVGAAVKGKHRFDKPADSDSDAVKVREEADAYAAEVRGKSDEEVTARQNAAKEAADAIVAEAERLRADAQADRDEAATVLTDAKAEAKAALDAAKAAKRN